jgi:hypothetical protein
MIASLDLLYIVLSVCLLFIAIPLTMILWRSYFMMKSMKHILVFVERLVKYGEELEKIPLSLLEKFKNSTK